MAVGRLVRQVADKGQVRSWRTSSIQSFFPRVQQNMHQEGEDNLRTSAPSCVVDRCGLNAA